MVCVSRSLHWRRSRPALRDALALEPDLMGCVSLCLFPPPSLGVSPRPLCFVVGRVRAPCQFWPGEVGGGEPWGLLLPTHPHACTGAGSAIHREWPGPQRKQWEPLRLLLAWLPVPLLPAFDGTATRPRLKGALLSCGIVRGWSEGLSRSTPSPHTHRQQGISLLAAQLSELCLQTLCILPSWSTSPCRPGSSSLHLVLWYFIES